ncbi:hypothetical protein GCM10009676_22660 [Prauserella halophila]|uniref:Uncharacterized protein n=1 Tax=Prauserella halophila TaxID=185641 RepID=A0ABN1W6B5_9PSEU
MCPARHPRSSSQVSGLIGYQWGLDNDGILVLAQVGRDPFPAAPESIMDIFAVRFRVKCPVRGAGPCAAPAQCRAHHQVMSACGGRDSLPADRSSREEVVTRCRRKEGLEQ